MFNGERHVPGLAEVSLMVRFRATSCLTVSLLLAGCQHSPQQLGHIRHEMDPAQCAVIASGASVHEALEKMRPDGTCDIRWWAS